MDENQLQGWDGADSNELMPNDESNRDFAAEEYENELNEIRFLRAERKNY